MKQVVDEKQFAKFIDRFNGFYDSSLVNISMRYNYNDGPEFLLEVSIATRDTQSVDEYESIAELEWVIVVIYLSRVTEIAVRESDKTSLICVSNGIHLSTVNGQIGFEFGDYYYEEPATLDELRQSDAYAVGEKLSFEVLPYSSD
ncbi:hypothetical protein [Kiloniella sp.]|uniref:hypothetical protein n=1 Tax=Kiloniella sp. TaxID=1938587 RepID=UPI003B029606